MIFASASAENKAVLVEWMEISLGLGDGVKMERSGLLIRKFHYAKAKSLPK